VCCLFCANLVLLLDLGSYDIHLGPLHLVAHQLFKPFLLVAASFWIAVFLGGLIRQPVSTATLQNRLATFFLLAVAIALYAAVYVPSAFINVLDPDWILKGTSADMRSLADVWRLFTTPRLDGFYRPLTLLSLRADYSVFGSALWGYHVQNILLHAVNSVLVFRVARHLRFERSAAFWTAAWFAFAAMNFEPVLWPAARFDLLATAFVLVSVILFLDYLRDSGTASGKLVCSASAYVLALMNKESAYCVPLLLLVIALTRNIWGLDSLAPRKLRTAAFVFGSITALMLAVRIAIYKGLGGYPASISGGASPHFSFTLKSITGLVTRVIPIPLLGLNTSVHLSRGIACFVMLYVAAIAWVVIQGGSVTKPEMVLVGLGLLSALPALNLTGWVGESMQHSRYLYLPGIWIIMAAAALIARRPSGNLLLAVLIAANLAGVVHNLGVYRSMLGRAHVISRQIAGDCRHYHADIVDLTDIDREPFGVFFFRLEIAESLQAANPDVCVRVADGACAQSRPALRYEWLPSSAGVSARYLPQGLAHQ
jgi:hypothetical protein